MKQSELLLIKLCYNLTKASKNKKDTMDPSKNQYSPEVIKPGGNSGPPDEQAQAAQSSSVSEQNQTDAQNTHVTEPSLQNDSSMVSPGTDDEKKPGSKFNKFLVALLALLVIAGGGAYGYFRWYNSPETVWSQGLDRSGTALNEYLDTGLELAEEQNGTDYQIDGSAEFNDGNTNYSGTFSSRFSPLVTDNNLDVTFSSDGLNDQDISLDVMTDLEEDAGYPDVFFRVNGLSKLGLEGFLPNINKFDNQWVEITSEQLEETLKQTIEAEELEPQASRATPEELRNLIRTVGSKISEYMLTSDEEKAVLTIEEFIEKETSDQEVESYRYNVIINPPSAKKFCEDLTKSVLAEPAFKKLTGLEDEKITQYNRDAKKECGESVDEMIEETGQIELWVDTENRMVHKIRIHDKVKASGYVEFGQVYEEEDNLGIFVNIRKRGEVSSDIKFNLDTNIRKNTASGEATFIYSNKSSQNSGKFNFDVKPVDGPIEVERPEGTININKVLNELGLGGLISF